MLLLTLLKLLLIFKTYSHAKGVKTYLYYLCKPCIYFHWNLLQPFLYLLQRSSSKHGKAVCYLWWSPLTLYNFLTLFYDRYIISTNCWFFYLLHFFLLIVSLQTTFWLHLNHITHHACHNTLTHQPSKVTSWVLPVNNPECAAAALLLLLLRWSGWWSKWYLWSSQRRDPFVLWCTLVITYWQVQKRTTRWAVDARSA